MNLNNIKIFIITHKETEIPDVEGYYPLMVGASDKNSISQMYLRDDSGDNISSRNDAYCELTGLYWIWNNVCSDYVGLVHYRRFFAKVNGFRYDTRYFCFNPLNDYSILSIDEISYLLTQTDIVVKRSEDFYPNNEAVFLRHEHVGIDNWNIVKSVISEYYPEYLEHFNQFAKEKYHINCNMFIGKKSVVDKYCEWLFEVISKIEAKRFNQYGDEYHNREIGYFAEILFGIWLNKNNINYQVINAINTAGINIEDCILPIYQFPKVFLKRLLKVIK